VRSGLELHTDDGVRLAATTWLTDASEPQAAVVIVHGLTSTKDHPTVVTLGDELAAQGFAVVAFDGRGHGASEGLCTLGDEEAMDVAAAVRHARTMSPRVIAVGSSMGAIAVLRYGTRDPDLAGVVSVSAPARWRIHSARSLVAAVMTRTRFGRDVVRRRNAVRLAPKRTRTAAPQDLAGRLSCPVVIVHGSRDRFIPVGEAERLYARAGTNRRLDIVPEMGHGFSTRATPAVVEAVRWVLSARNVDSRR
jgi:alpha-beta hydrolase superfamily lysophospholipase